MPWPRKPERPLVETRRGHRWPLIALAAVLLPSPVGARPQTPNQSRSESQIRAQRVAADSTDPWALNWLDEQAKRIVERGVTPGIAIVFVQDGRIVMSRAFGVTDLESEEPISTDRTRFPLGSFTKVVTAMSVLQQVEEGRLSLTEPASEYLDFAVPWEKTGEPITLHDLLTHTSGFAVRHIGIGTRNPELIKPLAEFVQTEPPPRLFAPGLLYQYSNYGYAVAGLVVAQVTQQPYESYVTERVLRPLGMSHTGFEPITRGETERALPYFCDIGFCRETPLAYGVVVPASGLVGTANDVARLLIALLPDGPLGDLAVIDRLSARQMVEHKVSPAPHRRPDGPTYGMFQYSDDGVLVATAPGWMGGFTTKVILYPDQGAGFVMLANSTQIEGLAHRLRTQIRRRRPCPFSAARDRVCEPPGRPAPADEHKAAIAHYREMSFENYGLARLGRQLMSTELVAFRNRTGALAVRLGRVDYELYEVAPSLFAAQNEPNTLYFSFLDLERDGSVDHVQVSDVAFERIPAWRASRVQLSFVTGLALLSASFLLLWPLLALRRPASERADTIANNHHRGPFGPRTSVFLLGLACILQLTSLVGLSYWVAEPQSALLALGMPRTLQLLRWVAVATMLVLPPLFVSVLEAWSRQYWYLSARTHFSVVAFGVAAYSAYAVYVGIIAV